MGKYTIEYENVNDLRLSINGLKYYSCLFDIDSKLRNVIKHGNPSKEVEELAESIRNMILDMNLDEIA